MNYDDFDLSKCTETPHAAEPPPTAHDSLILQRKRSSYTNSNKSARSSAMPDVVRSKSSVRSMHESHGGGGGATRSRHQSEASSPGSPSKSGSSSLIRGVYGSSSLSRSNSKSTGLTHSNNTPTALNRSNSKLSLLQDDSGKRRSNSKRGSLSPCSNSPTGLPLIEAITPNMSRSKSQHHFYASKMSTEGVATSKKPHRSRSVPSKPLVDLSAPPALPLYSDRPSHSEFRPSHSDLPLYSAREPSRSNRTFNSEDPCDSDNDQPVMRPNPTQKPQDYSESNKITLVDLTAPALNPAKTAREREIERSSTNHSSNIQRFGMILAFTICCVGASAYCFYAGEYAIGAALIAPAVLLFLWKLIERFRGRFTKSNNNNV